MGLSASQARLLTITARKSDCEFESMKYSHQKIALARQMADISNAYQNSLEQTKLVYDFYGTGDESLALSYGIMMSPSELNGYSPMLTTTANGKVVLDSGLAAAVKAAGIPQDGFATLPSEVVRNNFYDALAKSNVIKSAVAEECKNVPYSQQIGNGVSDLLAVVTKTVDYQGILDELSNVYSPNLSGLADSVKALKFKAESGSSGNSTEIYTIETGNSGNSLFDNNGVHLIGAPNNVLSLSDILKGNVSIICTPKDTCDNVDKDGNQIKGWYDGDNESYARTNRQEAELAAIQGLANWNGWEMMLDALDELLNTGDPQTDYALQYAREKVLQEYILQGYKFGLDYNSEDARDGYLSTHREVLDNLGYYNRYQKEKDGAVTQASSMVNDYIGYVVASNCTVSNGSNVGTVAISITNILKAYLTEFLNFTSNVKRYTVDSSGTTCTDLKEAAIVTGNRSVASSRLVDNNSEFEIVLSKGVNTNNTLQSGFYDALFNQICLRGWTENNNITDNDYLRESYQNGLLFLATMDEDGYYYQGNYGANSYIKEVTDENAIAIAEAQYNTEKARLQQKEEAIDMKMKNLDTEISALTTEYETTTQLIKNNVKKSFDRYKA